MLDKKDINWSHFATRSRKNKETGKYEYDRVYTTIEVDGRPWLENKYNAGDIINMFILGKGNNVAFVHKAGDPIVYVNKRAGARAQELSIWYAEQAQAEVRMVEDLPTNEHIRRGGGAVKYDSLETLMAGALRVDLGL